MYDDFLFLNESLYKHSTIRIGGQAKYFFVPRDFRECLKAFEFAKSRNLPIYILGNGSNTLCSSSGFDGVVINTLRLNTYETEILRVKRASLQKWLCKTEETKHYFVNKGAHYIAKNNVCNLESGGRTYKAVISDTNSVGVESGVSCEKGNSEIKRKDGRALYPLKPILKVWFLLVRAWSGALLPRLSNDMARRGYAGLEFACSIPATLGGATRMNAGAFGGQMADIVYRALVYNYKTGEVYYKYNEKLKNTDCFARNLASCHFGDYKERKVYCAVLQKNCKALGEHSLYTNGNFGNNSYCETNRFEISPYIPYNNACNAEGTCFFDDGSPKHKVRKTAKWGERKRWLRFDYRHADLLDCEFIIAVDCVLRKGNREEIQERVKNNVAKRQSTQNVGLPSLGSVFKRVGEFAPALAIDRLALKGLRVGGAMVSPKHAGYIVNAGNAKSQDVYKLLKIIKRIICKNYNIMVQYELKFLGSFYEEK